MLSHKLFRGVSVQVLAIGWVSGAALAQQSLPTIDIGARTPRSSQRTVPSTTGAPSLSPSSQDGPPIEQTTAGPVRGYQALTTRATRFQTPIQELPMSVQVIPRKLIDDQQAISQAEVFRNVSGLQPVSPLFPGGIGPSLRGMRAERYIDGLPNYYDLGVRDLLVNVERIEVLKGPASILFQGGQSPVGGVVNIVSKLPTPDRFAEAGVRGGGYSYVSPYIDVNQPLTENKSVLFRLTAQYETTRSNIDVVHRRSYTINPTIKIAPTDATSLIVQGIITRRDQPDYAGLPAVGTIDRTFYAVRPTAFLSTPGLPSTGTSSSGVTLRFDHKFDEVFSTFTSARFSSSGIYEPSQIPFGNTPTFYADPVLALPRRPGTHRRSEPVLHGEHNPQTADEGGVGHVERHGQIRRGADQKQIAARRRLQPRMGLRLSCRRERHRAGSDHPKRPRLLGLEPSRRSTRSSPTSERRSFRLMSIRCRAKATTQFSVASTTPIKTPA